jgi:hypothetical protein
MARAFRAMSRPAHQYFAPIMGIAARWRSLDEDWNGKVSIQSGVLDLGQFDLAVCVACMMQLAGMMVDFEY